LPDGTFLDFLGIVAQVSETPDEPDDGTPGPGEGGDGGQDEPDSHLRGWIDPDDRLWRHPSEVADSGHPRSASPLPRRNHRNAVMVLVGVGAVVAVVAWVVVLLSPASDHPLESTTQDSSAGGPLTTLAGVQNALPVAAAATGHSIVELQATTTHGTVQLVGVAVAEGGLVATTADLLGGVKRIDMVGAGGKLQAASVVATDKTSDVALISVPIDLPVATFADDSGVDTGTPDLALSFVSTGGHAVALRCTAGAVTDVGTAITSGPASTMPSITSSPASPALLAGEPLLDENGAVLGILYEPDAGSSATTFLPSDLVVGVADDLRSEDRVVHGWLGVQGTDAPDGGGARVAEVQSGGPASHVLQVGQLIVAVDSIPVRTMAELRARLYVLAPGTPVTLSVQQPGEPKVVDVTLGTSS
jgi:S1-C subfamily serine protease